MGVTKPAAASRRYWVRLLLLAFVLLLVALVCVPTGLGALTMVTLLRPSCNSGANPQDVGIVAESVQLIASDGVVSDAYFFPGTNRAAVIVAPAFNNSRGSELYYVRVMNDAGYTVLTLNSRACTANSHITLGYDEVLDVQAAFAYVRTRPEVDAGRIGLFGFSSAGATSIMAAARLPEVRSVVAMGGYHNYAEALGESGDIGVRLYQAGAWAAYRLLTGYYVSVLDPISAIDDLPPRPLFLIYGSREVSLPGARAMLARAQSLGMDARLWVMDGADHGEYMQIDPQSFQQQVIAFEDATLLQPAS